MTTKPDEQHMGEPYMIGTEVPGIGVIKAIKGGKPRDYLLVDEDGTVTWLDELAINGILTQLTSGKDGELSLKEEEKDE